MSLHELRSSNISGIPTEEYWSCAFSSTHFFLTIVLQKKDEINLAASGKQFLIRFEEAMQAIDPISQPAFKETIKKLLSESPDELIVSFSAGVITNTALVICSVNSTIFLHRKKIIKPILKNTATTPIFASGTLETGDAIFFTTNAFAHLFAQDKDVIASLDSQEAGDELVTLLHKSEKQEQLAVTYVLYGRKEQEESGPIGELPQPVVETALPLPQPASSQTQKKFSLPFSFKRQIITPAFAHTFRQMVTGRTRMVLFGVCMLLGVVFLTSIIVAFQKQHTSTQDQQFQTAFASAKDKYDQGEALISLNQTLSQKTLQEAKQITSSTLPTLSDTYPRKKELEALDQQIDQALLKALKVVVIQNPQPFFDLTLVKDNAKGSRMVLLDNTFFILDEANKATYKVTTSKQSDLVGGNLNKPTFVTLTDTSGFVFDANGVESISFSQKKLQKIIGKDNDWGDIGALASFGNTLYLLDKTKNTIYKYDATANASKKSYFASDFTPDFSNAVSLSIDGVVWVLFNNGQVAKYASGSPQDYNISGLDSAFSNPKVITTQEDAKNIYILDSGNKRVVSLTKDGLYQSQYRWDQMGSVSDIAVSEKDKKLYLLSSSKMYSVDLSL